jgi:hypothetical protein
MFMPTAFPPGRRNLLRLFLFTFVAVCSLSLSQPSVISNRRSILSKFGALPSLLVGAPTAFASITNPEPKSIITVILDSAANRVGVELYDVKIGGSNTYPAVRRVDSNGIAARNRVQEGMIVLGGRRSAEIVSRIKKGPYPVVLQFYNVAEDPSVNAASALASAQEAAQQRTVKEEPPPVSPKGAGLIVKTTRKGDSCEKKARRGDTLEIRYEARVASPGGPLYDSTEERGQPVTFVLGKGEAIKGVDIGLNGMCVGEVSDLSWVVLCFVPRYISLCFPAMALDSRTGYSERSRLWQYRITSGVFRHSW